MVCRRQKAKLLTKTIEERIVGNQIQIQMINGNC